MRLIDANELREDLKRFFPTDVLEGIEPKTLFAQIMHNIDNAPTIEMTERPHGEWVLYEDSYFNKCSLCGDVWLEVETEYFNFCPNCGADMKGGAEEGDAE